MKKSKALDRALNIITIIIAVIVIIIAISTITSASKGYNSMFGVSGINVLSDSMKGDKEDSFKKGDLIYIDILKAEEKSTLKVGDIITFYDNIEGVKALNSHRIIEVIAMENQPLQYRTKGDANPAVDLVGVNADEVIGKYTGNKLVGIGSVAAFIKGPIGFMIFVVVPSFLVVAYALFRVIKNYSAVNREKTQLAVENAKAELTEDEKAKLREEYLQSMKNTDSGDGENSPKN